MYDIITIGEILCEILAQDIDQQFTNPGVLLGPYPSGAPAIFIDQAARMGAKASIIAKIGKDDFGKLNTDRLSQDGVDITNIQYSDNNTTGCAFVTYFQDGSRKFLFHFTHAACGELCAQDVDVAVIEQAKYLHIMGCSITGSKTMGEAIMQAVRYAKQHGVKISFDPNIRPELLTGTIMDYYSEILDCCDVLLTGKSELAHLMGDAKNGVETLLKQKDRIIAIKNGARGTNVYTRNQTLFMPTFPVTEVDPTGAGDCFDATFLACLVAGMDLSETTKYANAAGALGVQKRGPMEGNSDRKTIEAFIQSCMSDSNANKA